MSTTESSFRADIEGLRAVAVIAVLIFHLNKEWLPGGFVGVDVFFVISGFIITRQLLDLQVKGTFSLISFWARRFRRLYPAMLSVILLTLIASFFVLPPTVYLETAESGLAAILMGANIYFSDRVGYFAPVAANRELLHLWSLSFEQQFYLLAPLLFIWRPTIRTTTIVFSTIAIVSFALAIYLVHTDPDRAFYLPFGRFWEIALGALIAVWLRTKPPQIKAPTALSLISLSLLIFSFLWIKAKNGFPDFQALIPTLATAALIVVGATENKTQLLLTNPIMRWHGRVSYTLYLVHWPVIVLFDKVSAQLSLPFRLMLVLAITYALTIFIHRFIETPMRYRQSESRTTLIKFATLSSLAIAACGLVVLDKGSVWRLPDQAKKVHAYRQYEAPSSKVPTCLSPDHIKMPPRSGLCQYQAKKVGKSFLLLGDSHMGMMAPQAAEALFDAGYQSGFTIHPAPSCPILTGVIPLGKAQNRQCDEAMAKIADIIVNQIKPDRLFLISRWANFGSHTKAPHAGDHSIALIASQDKTTSVPFLKALEQTIDTFSSIPITIVASVPEQAVSIPNAMIRGILLDTPIDAMSLDQFFERQSVVFDALKSIENRVDILYPHDIFCSDTKCSYAANNIPLYYDDNHLTHTGALKLQPMFRNAKH